MEISKIDNYPNEFRIHLSDETVIVQRKYPETAADDPMTYDELLRCVLCETNLHLMTGRDNDRK